MKDFRFAIHRFKIPRGENKFTLEIPKNSRFLSLQVKDGQPNLWYEVEVDSRMEKRTFRVLATGEEYDLQFRGNTYLGTFQIEGTQIGTLVYHLFVEI